uniref:Uncharacterized protein n=1 Tax=Eutreptiella gymnastica TaxID=73025 RepID=A0A7S4LC86_9EUGL
MPLTLGLAIRETAAGHRLLPLQLAAERKPIAGEGMAPQIRGEGSFPIVLSPNIRCFCDVGTNLVPLSPSVPWTAMGTLGLCTPPDASPGASFANHLTHGWSQRPASAGRIVAVLWRKRPCLGTAALRCSPKGVSGFQLRGGGGQ